MAIHLFNPPEPCGNPTKGCGNCSGLPVRWRLTVPEYLTSPPINATEPGDRILRRSTVKLSDLSTPCQWAPQLKQPEPFGPFADDTWILGYNQSFATATGPSPAASLKPGWTIYIPVNDQSGRRKVYWQMTPFAQTGIFLEDFVDSAIGDESTFRCLGVNRFWYVDSVGNETGTNNAEFEGWPNTLILTPWYGENS